MPLFFMVQKNFDLAVQLIKKIGVIDSGRGGLTILQAMLAEFPAEYYYLADIKNLPYGTKSYQELLDLTIKNINYLRAQKINIIIFACHTLSAIVLSDVKKIFPNIIFIDVLEPVVQAALLQSKNKKIGIMATEATIKSQTHKKRLIKNDKTIEVIEQACPTLASMIEDYEIYEKKIIIQIQAYAQQFIKLEVDTLILGCTHYDLVKELIANFIPAKIVSAQDIIYDYIMARYNFISLSKSRDVVYIQTIPNDRLKNELQLLLAGLDTQINFFYKILDSYKFSQ